MSAQRDGASRAPQPPDQTSQTDSNRPTAPIPAQRSLAAISSGPQSLVASRSPSAVVSPWSSRDSSPRRMSAATTNNPRTMRSRKNSTDVSPSRSQQAQIPNIPSAAAIQRAISTSTTPSLPHPASEQSSRLPRAPRSHPNANEMGLHWPVSPRLKSPPPGTGPRRSSARNSSAKSEPTATLSETVNPKTPTNTEVGTPTAGSSSKREGEKQLSLQPPMKPPVRGISGPPKLETVQEGSQPSTPADELKSFIAGPSSATSTMKASEVRSAHSPTKSAILSGHEGAESSDSSARSRRRRADSSTVDPDKTPKAIRPVVPKPSQASLRPRSTIDSSNKNMTVETETVDSVAQATLNMPDRSISGRSDMSGTLKIKASNETIRPKKERKRPSRKAPSLNAANASSRADIFEGQVMDAMDQASSDDSDETFVYESNPPDIPYRSRSRNHSRTPSANSLASMTDQRSLANRTITGMIETQRPMQKSRSMKFANNTYHSGADDDQDRQDGTVRAHRGHGSGLYHHHLGARQNRNGHTSILDDDNPTFPNMQKIRSVTGLAGRQSHNARLAAQHLRGPNSTVRKGDGYSSYDMDDDPADDERTPLVGTVRGTRSRGSIQPSRSRYPYSPQRHHRSFLSRCAGCFVLFIMILLLASGVIGFMFAVSKPLTEVQVTEIKNVLVSEQEIMLDMVVEAINPNILPINIVDMDINIFAKSKYVGSEKWWREHPVMTEAETVIARPNRKRRAPRRTPRNTDAAINPMSYTVLPGPNTSLDDDPIDEPTPGNGTISKSTMLLGHIYHFDTPLSFDGSFWRRTIHHSTGSLSLAQPGNKTELGGTERWERVLKHDFELIIRGVLKYSIPLGGSRHSANVNSIVVVQPEQGEGPGDGGNTGDLDGIGHISEKI